MWSPQEAVDLFVAAFNSPTADGMAELLPRAFTRDVTFWGPLGRTEGLDTFEEFMGSLRGHPRGPGSITRTTVVDAPGEWARYGWAYAEATGEVVLHGTDMVHLRDGRIDRMVVFSGTLAGLPGPMSGTGTGVTG